ncbi:MAG: DUF2206 domain-containing protein [Candidatus Bathyarchaeia archaeon]
MSIILDLPFVTQVIGFVYLFIIPGMLIVILLDLIEINKTEFILFSVGFSCIFLMFIGFLTNEIGYLLCINNPLTKMNLIIVLNSFVVMFEALIFLFRAKFSNIFSKKTMLQLRSLSFLLVIGIPILSIAGGMTTYISASNFLVLLLTIAISLIFIVGINYTKITPKVYVVFVFAIAISLLLCPSLISKYLTSFASDNPIEHYLFKVTKTNEYWNSSLYGYDTSYGRVNAMLSVTILPTIYSSLLNLDDTWVMKIFYPILFSFVPVALYNFWQMRIGHKKAFIAAFLLMADFTFYSEMLGLCRQIVAELFFALLLITIFHPRMRQTERFICFMAFSGGLIFSHYALAEIFSFFISLALILFFIKSKPIKITVATVVFFNVLLFLWYIYISNAATFNSFIFFGQHVYVQLTDFFNLESRGSMVLRGLGLEPPPTIWNAVGRAFVYITELFILIGFIALITNKKNSHLKIEKEYFVFIVLSVLFLIMLIVVPGLARTMNMTRFYHILLFFIAPLFALGIEKLLQILIKRRKDLYISILAGVILVPYFLFQSGFVYEIVKVRSHSLPLSSYRMDPVFLISRGYFTEFDIYSALWLSRYNDIDDLSVYADSYSIFNLLTNYGMIYRDNMKILLNNTNLLSNSVVYFNNVNMFNGFIQEGSLINITRCEDIFYSSNKIYSNGASEILKTVESINIWEK